MGLDMYLYAKRYMSRFVDEKDSGRQETIAQLFPELTRVQARQAPVKEVSVEIGYWRKLNAVHKWFVDNVQSGKDDCKEYYVSIEDLQSLREVCMKALANRSQASEILPTMSGFFFGSQEQDEWFFAGIEDTVRIIDDCLSLPNGWNFYYQSSW